MPKLLLFFVEIVVSSSLLAADARPAAEDPVLEARVTEIAEHLRCLVCQNQTIADSNAGLAIDLKNQVRDMLKQGRDEKQVIDFMVQRYGDFVLYKPPVKPSTWLLWVGPFLLFGAGLATLYVKLKNRRKQMAGPLSEQQHLAALRMLEGGGSNEHVGHSAEDENNK